MKNTFAVTITLLLALTLAGSVTGYRIATTPHEEKAAETSSQTTTQEAAADASEAATAQVPPEQAPSANVAATLPDVGALSEGLKALATAARQSDGKPSSQESIAGRAEALAARAEDGANRAASLPAPGVRASVVTAGERGVRLRATFDRPIAVGYRGIALQPAAGGPCEFAPVQVPTNSPGVMPAPPPPQATGQGRS